MDYYVIKPAQFSLKSRASDTHHNNFAYKLQEMSIKDFTIITKLGQGAYSSVYKVERIADHKQYALKKVKLGNLSEKQIQNAVNEVRILASINNPNIIGYKEAFLQGKNLCVVMEFANGGDLYQKIVQNKKSKKYFEEEEIWSTLIQITKGLKALHDLKILHRDLKSANVFLTKEGEAKLGDMNVSKIAKNGLLYTQTGTPYYASPEVWKDKPYDSKSDIWSLGCVIYEMTALQPPFKAEDMQGLYETVTNGIYPPIPSFYSKQLSSVIKLMLQQNPANRPSTQKLLKSSLLLRKSSELGILNSEQASSDLLKTIHIPKKLHYLTDRLPQSNYDGIKNSKSMKKNRFPTEKQETRERQHTLPKLEGIIRYHDSSIKRKSKQSLEKRTKSTSLQVQGLSKAVRNDRRSQLDNKQEIQKQINRIHNQGQKSKMEPRIHYRQPKINYKALPPLRK